MFAILPLEVDIVAICGCPFHRSIYESRCKFMVDMLIAGTPDGGTAIVRTEEERLGFQLKIQDGEATKREH